MAVRTLAQQLEDVDAAIARSLSAISLGIGDRNLQRATLKDLRAEKDTITREMVKGDKGRRTVAEF